MPTPQGGRFSRNAKGDDMVHFRCPKDVHQALKHAAAADNRTQRDYIVVAVREKMDRDMQRATSTPWLPRGVRRMQ